LLWGGAVPPLVGWTLLFNVCGGRMYEASKILRDATFHSSVHVTKVIFHGASTACIAV